MNDVGSEITIRSLVGLFSSVIAYGSNPASR